VGKGKANEEGFAQFIGIGAHRDAATGRFIGSCGGVAVTDVRQENEFADLPIPPEEYSLLAFGNTWLTEYVMSDRNISSNRKPECILLDETPTMEAAESDLIYWWHHNVQYFPCLENRARIRMIQLAKKNKKFDRTELGKHLDIAESTVNIDNATWKFRVSRVGYDIGSRQAIGHFPVFVDGPGYLNWGCILVMEWGEDDMISLKTARHTLGPGR